MLIGAALLLILMSVFHSLVGERFILAPIKAADNLTKIWDSRQAMFRTIQATWHLVSVLWLGLAAYLLALQFAPDRAIWISLVVFGAIFGVLAIVPLVWDSGKHKSWIPFGIISGLLLASAFL